MAADNGDGDPDSEILVLKIWLMSTCVSSEMHQKHFLDILGQFYDGAEK